MPRSAFAMDEWFRRLQNPLASLPAQLQLSGNQQPSAALVPYMPMIWIPSYAPPGPQNCRPRLHLHSANPSGCPEVGNPAHSTFEEIDLCREIVWNCSSDGIQYSRIKEVDRIYAFIAGFNLKFDIVRRSISGQRPIPSLIECEVPCHDSEKHTGK
ncbi:Copia protein [Cucumis melo var. makuwa]|uniref:Copia protein n=1 Tax=Cucumis melo var. makuwa TaxID=1194695 RepID=A0A5A7UUE6_CUCMM|nr:Copia protein [Cucumis melo var. makuwa]TYK14106.1 Copia protein [Cucumis melo var. makuwa]